MPDIKMFQLLSKEFHVSINELLSGEGFSDEKFRQKADVNLIAVSKSSAFSLEERKSYSKQKWRRDHILLFVILGLILMAAVVLLFVLRKPWAIGFAPLVAVVEYGYQNNQMMAFVENHLYH